MRGGGPSFVSCRITATLLLPDLSFKPRIPEHETIRRHKRI